MVIVKSIKNSNSELILKRDGNLYSVIRLVGGNESNVITNLDEESAFDTFDYFQDMETENDK
jgi:hypothetical protein